MEQALLLDVGLHQSDVVGPSAGEAQIAQRLGVHREDAAGGAVLGRHVGDRRPVGQRQLGQSFAEELHELADDALLAQHLRDAQDKIGSGAALRQPAAQPKADHLGNQHRHRLAEHGRLRLDAAHAPAQDAQAVYHRRVRVGANQRVGVDELLIADRLALLKTTWARYSRLTWWTMPVSGGTTRKFQKAFCPQRRKA